MNKLFAALALCGLASAPTVAATLVGSQLSGGSVLADYSADGLIAFDLDLANLAPVTLSYQINAGDLGGLDFNAVIRNLAGVGLNSISFSLNGASFQSLGTVTRSFDPSVVVTGSSTGQQAWINFGSPEYLDVSIGNPLDLPGAVNWALNPGSFNAGDVITLTVAVPEPESYALMLAGLSVAALAVRRRRG